MFSLKDFDQLSAIQHSDTPCVSIFIPTNRSGNFEEDRIRFKNALSDAVDQLTDESILGDKAVEKPKATKYLSSAYELLENEEFWKHLSDGLAVFAKEGHFSYFTVPVDFPKFVQVHDHFYLRHLLPLLDKDNRFFVLALSMNEVRFFEGRENSITPVIIADLVPMGKEDMMVENEHEPQINTHGGQGGVSVYHGQGGGKDDKKAELVKYFRTVDDGLMEMLHDEDAPLIIYAVDYEIPIYREISKYSNIYDEHISGNPDNEDPVLIHEKAWSVISGHFEDTLKEKLGHFNQSLAEDKASFSVNHIVPAAINGKVELLYADKDTEALWGVFNEQKNSVTIHQERQPDSVCLLNKAAIGTVQNGGDVYNVPREGFPRIASLLNAIYRY